MKLAYFENEICNDYVMEKAIRKKYEKAVDMNTTSGGTVSVAYTMNTLWPLHLISFRCFRLFRWSRLACSPSSFVREIVKYLWLRPRMWRCFASTRLTKRVIVPIATKWLCNSVIFQVYSPEAVTTEPAETWSSSAVGISSLLLYNAMFNGVKAVYSYKGLVVPWRWQRDILEEHQGILSWSPGGFQFLVGVLDMEFLECIHKFLGSILGEN